MRSEFIVVESLVATERSALNMREHAWEFALDQRAFGPRRLLVAVGDPDGHVRAFAHTLRTTPPELGLGPCLDHVRGSGTVALAFCDEVIHEGPPPDDLAGRFAEARTIAASQGVLLIDWIACDDQLFRSSQIALHPDEPWWPDNIDDQ